MADEKPLKPPISDLLGDPWTEPPDPRGRPAHVRNPQIAEKVALLRATGGTEQEIADRICLSVPTLKKYYFRELETGPTLLRAVLDESMWAKAKAGSVSAARYLNERLKDGAAAVPLARLQAAASSDEEAEDPADKSLGLKASANRDAKTAHEGSAWADVLPNQKPN